MEAYNIGYLFSRIYVYIWSPAVRTYVRIYMYMTL